MRFLILTCALALVSTPFVTHGQNSELRTQYFRIEDRTSVSTKSQSVKGSNLYVQFYFNHKGSQLKEQIQHVGLVIDSTSSQWKYLKPESLKLFVLADDERFSIDGKRYDSDVNTGYRNVTVSERLLFAVALDQLKKMATADSLELQLGQEQFKFSDKTRKGIREMVALFQNGP